MAIIRTPNSLVVQDFIRKYWKCDHSLVKSTMLLVFQHFNNNDNMYNYYLIEESEIMWGILGYIPTSHFDPSLECEKDVWGAIWKVRDDCHLRGIGLELMDNLINNYKGSFGAIGISKIAKKIYHLYGMIIGRFSQYYIVNPAFQNFKIAYGVSNSQIIAKSSEKWNIITELSLNNVEDLDCNYRPRKTVTYLRNRYEKHPIYKYFFWVIKDGEKNVSIWVLRRITIDDHSVLRVVDILGDIDEIPNIGCLIQDKLMKEGVEYIDCLNYGIPSFLFEKMGFIEHDPYSEEVIIPNYFEPFEKRNVIIELAYKADFNYVAFKGDSDQDRPNIL